MPRNAVMQMFHEKLTQLFNDEEIAMIWAALNSYDVGPKTANSKLWEELEERRKDLLAVFE